MADPKVDIRVKTTAENTGALGQVEGFLKRIKEGGGAASKAIDGIAGVIRGPLAAASAVLASLAGAFAGLTKSVSEYADAQEKVAKLDAALSQRGLLSGEFRERLQELAGELQATTAVADDEWLEVLRRLIQFGSTPESIGMDVEAVKNLAGIIGDVSSAANLYSRALQGNYDMFARYGIVVRDAGTQTEKLNDLQEQLARRGGGQLEAQAKSLNGQWAALKNSTSDLLEAIGSQIARTGVLQSVLGGLLNVTSAWADILGGTVKQLDGLKNQTGDAEKALASYRAQLEGVAKLSDAIVKSTKAETDAIKAKQAAIDEVADAQMALDLLRVDEAEASGKISKRGGIKARSAIRSAAAKAKYDREQTRDLDVLSSQERAARDLGTQMGNLRSRRSELETSLVRSQVKENTWKNSKEQIARIDAELKSIQDMAWTEISNPQKGTRERVAQLTALRGKWAAVAPADFTQQRAELAAIREQEAALAPKYQSAVSELQGSKIPAEMAKREALYGINSQRESIGTSMALTGAAGDDAKRQLESIQRGAAGVGQQVGGALDSVERALGRTVSVVTRFEKRLDALEASQRNALNK